MKLDQFQERRRTKEENVVLSPISSGCEVGSVSKKSTKSEKNDEKKNHKNFQIQFDEERKNDFKKIQMIYSKCH